MAIATKTKTKTFIAKITPVTVVKKDTQTGVRYSLMQGATVETRGKGGKPTSKIRTVMAFGRKNAAVANILRAGRTVELLCSYDKGSVHIEGKSPKLVKKAA